MVGGGTLFGGDGFRAAHVSFAFLTSTEIDVALNDDFDTLLSSETRSADLHNRRWVQERAVLGVGDSSAAK